MEPTTPFEARYLCKLFDWDSYSTSGSYLRGTSIFGDVADLFCYFPYKIRHRAYVDAAPKSLIITCHPAWHKGPALPTVFPTGSEATAV